MRNKESTGNGLLYTDDNQSLVRKLQDKAVK